MPTLGGVQLIAYADDLAVVVTGKALEHIQAKANYTLRRICERLLDKKLSIAPHKTEAVLLVGGRKIRTLELRVRNIDISSQESIKYLGVYMDRNMKMREHIRTSAAKARKALTNICRLMPRIRGPREGSKRILCSVAESIMLYGAPIWIGAMNKKVYRNTYLSVQRLAAIRIIGAYRTTSTKALLVLARMPPIHLLAKHRIEMIEGKTSKADSNSRLLSSWQNWWNMEDGTAGWTKTLIPDLRPWYNRKHGEMNFFLAQLLSGHGNFQSYLCRFKISNTEECNYCNEKDTAQHTFFECLRWNTDRHAVEKKLGILTPQNLVSKMLNSEQEWNDIDKYAIKILSAKDKEIRQMRQVSNEH